MPCAGARIWGSRDRLAMVALVRLASIVLSATCLLTPLRVEGQSASRSIGSPDAGRLRNGVHFDDGAAHHGNGRGADWGTRELVDLLGRAISTVYAGVPNTPSLFIGDLSRRRGGPAPPHVSHTSGRDADIGFYYEDASGQPLRLDRFVRINGRGHCSGPGTAGCRLDVARTWRLMEALVVGDTPVQYLFISPRIRELLLAEAQRVEASQTAVTRFRVVSAPMRGSREHVTHFHLRVYCAPDDRPRCADQGPLHAWYPFTDAFPPAFVAEARELAERRVRVEWAAEGRDRERRARREARRIAAARRAAELSAARRARRERARARLAAAAAAEAEARAARAARRARARARAEAAEAAARAERSARRARARARAEAAEAEARAARATRRARSAATEVEAEDRRPHGATPSASPSPRGEPGRGPAASTISG